MQGAGGAYLRRLARGRERVGAEQSGPNHAKAVKADEDGASTAPALVTQNPAQPNRASERQKTGQKKVGDLDPAELTQRKKAERLGPNVMARPQRQLQGNDGVEDRGSRNAAGEEGAIDRLGRGGVHLALHE